MPEKSQPDPQLGKQVFAINLIARPSAELLDSIVKLQDSLEDALPGRVVHRAPADSIHMSIFQFVWARDQDAASREEVWRVHQDDVISALHAVTLEGTDVSLLGPTVEVRKAAIILVFPTSTYIEALRHRVETSGALAGLECRRPTLQHISLFRYLAEVPLDQLRLACQEIEVTLPAWQITALELVREVIYPSLRLKLLHKFSLT